MSKIVLIQQQQPNPPNGPYFGRVSDPAEFMNMQVFAHEHTEGVVKDFLMPGATGPLVGSGFDYTLPGGLGVSVAAGRAVKPDGKSYDTLPLGQASVVTMAVADPTLPRIDLVYALLETAANAAPVFKPFVQLRTQAQLEAGVEAYPPSQLSVPAEQYNRATIQVRTGTPNANPAAPAVGANEVALYNVRVNAGAVVLNAGHVTDVRSKARSLFNAWVGIDAINQSPAILNLSEAIDDRVSALIPDSTYFTKLYDDAGNLLTFDADLVAFDARYVNADGDTMTGALSVTPAFNAAQNAVTGNNTSQANGGVSRGGNFVASSVGVPINAEFIGVKGHASTGGLGAAQSFFAGVYGSVSSTGGGGGNVYHAGYFNGNLTCTGGFSKGSGTFHIDHPLDPLNKDLIHGFVESNKYLLTYKLVVVLQDGTRTVNLDTELGFSAGTFAALCQEAEIVSVRVKGEHAASVTDIVGAAFTVDSGTAPDGTEVVIVVMAERKDPFILLDQWVDGNGRLIPEHTKAVPSAEALALLNPVTITVPSANPLAGETVPELVPVLIGLQGYPRQPQAVEDTPTPVRQTTYEGFDGEVYGPYFPSVGTDNAAVGTAAWINLGGIIGPVDGDFAQCVPFAETTHYLKVADFQNSDGQPVTIPAGRTPAGVKISISRRDLGGGSGIKDLIVKLVKGGVVSGDNKADTITLWSQGDQFMAKVYGGPDDTWGLSLTSEDMETLGVVLSAVAEDDATARVESFSMTLYCTVDE